MALWNESELSRTGKSNFVRRRESLYIDPYSPQNVDIYLPLHSTQEQKVFHSEKGLDYRTNETRPDSFIDLCHKVDYIIQLLQGSPDTKHLLNSDVTMLINKLNQVESKSETISQSINSLKTILGTSQSRSIDLNPTILQHLNDIKSQMNLIIPLNESKAGPNMSERASLDPRSALLLGQQDSFNNDPFNLNSAFNVPNSNVTNSQILELLEEIRTRIGGNIANDSLSSTLGQVQETLGRFGMIEISQGQTVSTILSNLNTEILTLQNRISRMELNWTDDNLGEFRNSLKEIIVPSMTDTLNQTSNALINMIRNELQSILSKYTEINRSLLDFRQTVSHIDQNTKSTTEKVGDIYNELTSQINNSIQMLRQLYNTTSQLVGQANDNTALIFNINDKISGLDDIKNMISNANTLLAQNINQNSSDINQLIRENNLLREQLRSLVNALQTSVV